MLIRRASSSRRRPVRLAGVAVLVTVGVVVSGCAGPSATYLTSSDHQAFAKLPTSWHVFSNREMMVDATAGLAASERSDLRGRLWLNAFDASPRPSMRHVNKQEVNAPVGQFLVRKLLQTEQDTVNFRALRNLHFAIDTGVQNGTASLLEYSPISNRNGTRGVDLTGRIQLGDDQASSVMFRQRSAVNPVTNRLATIFVVCKTECFEENQRAANLVVDSFTFKGL